MSVILKNLVGAKTDFTARKRISSRSLKVIVIRANYSALRIVFLTKYDMESTVVVTPKLKTDRTQWETPGVSYDIKAHDLLKILQKRFSAKLLSKETIAKLFTDLIDYSTTVVEEPPNIKRGVRKLPKERTIADFTEKQVYGLFHMPDAGAYQYLELRISPSERYWVSIYSV